MEGLGDVPDPKEGPEAVPDSMEESGTFLMPWKLPEQFLNPWKDVEQFLSN